MSDYIVSDKMLVINITYTKQNNLYYTISIILHWLCAKCQGKLLVLTKFCQGKKNSLFSKKLAISNFFTTSKITKSAVANSVSRFNSN